MIEKTDISSAIRQNYWSSLLDDKYYSLKARSTNIPHTLKIQLEYSQNISPFSETNNARICVHIYFNVLCLVYGVSNTFLQQ